MDEFAAVIKAREFVRKVNPTGIPVRVEAYVEEAKAVLRPQNDLGWMSPAGPSAMAERTISASTPMTGPSANDLRSATSLRISSWV
jgi:hypothetical protein